MVSHGYLIGPTGRYLNLGERQYQERSFSLSGFQSVDWHVFLHLTGTVTQEAHSVGVLVLKLELRIPFLDLNA